MDFVPQSPCIIETHPMFGMQAFPPCRTVVSPRVVLKSPLDEGTCRRRLEVWIFLESLLSAKNVLDPIVS